MLEYNLNHNSALWVNSGRQKMFQVKGKLEPSFSFPSQPSTEHLGMRLRLWMVQGWLGRDCGVWMFAQQDPGTKDTDRLTGCLGLLERYTLLGQK